MKRILFLLLFLPCLVFADQHGFDLLTGGATSALDGIAEADITDADIAAGRDGTNWRTYYYDATSAATESSPDVIAPDDVAANGRWLIIGSITATQVAYLSGTIAVNDIPKFSDSVTMIGRSYSEHLTDVGLSSSDSPAYNALTLTGTNTLALGTFSTTDGMIFFNNATNANTFTIETGVTGAAIGWILPTAAPVGDGYYATFDIDGTINYVSGVAGATAVNDIGDAAADGAVDYVSYDQDWDMGTGSQTLGDGGVANFIEFVIGGFNIEGTYTADFKTAIVDLGDTTLTLPASSVTAAAMADGDHGAFTYTSNVAVLDANTVDYTNTDGSSKSLTPVTGTAAGFAAGFTGANLYGGTYVVNVTGTVQFPLMVEGMNFTIVTLGAIAVIADTNVNDGYLLDGVTGAEGANLTNLSTAGDIIDVRYYTTDDWIITSNGWTAE